MDPWARRVLSSSIDHDETCRFNVLDVSDQLASTWSVVDVRGRRVETRPLDVETCRFYVVEDSTRRVKAKTRAFDHYDSLSTSRLVASTCASTWSTSVVRCARQLQNRRARRESIADSTSSRVARALGIVEPIREGASPIAVEQC